MFEVIKLMPVVILAGLMIGGFDALIASTYCYSSSSISSSNNRKKKI